MDKAEFPRISEVYGVELFVLDGLHWPEYRKLAAVMHFFLGCSL